MLRNRMPGKASVNQVQLRLTIGFPQTMLAYTCCFGGLELCRWTFRVFILLWIFILLSKLKGTTRSKRKILLAKILSSKIAISPPCAVSLIQMIRSRERPTVPLSNNQHVQGYPSILTSPDHHAQQIASSSSNNFLRSYRVCFWWLAELLSFSMRL